MKKRVIQCLLVCLLVGVFSLNALAENKSTYYEEPLRILLKTYYHNKDSFTFNNNKVILGYEVDGAFEPEMLFSGYRKYEVKPLISTFIISKTYFETFNEADKVSKELQQLGFPAFAGGEGPGEWHIYMGRYNTKSEANKALKTIEGAYSNYNFFVKENVDNLYKLSGDGEVLALINHQQFAPQFMSGDQEGVLDLGKRMYRGRVEFNQMKEGNLSAINVIGFTEYLYGVVPAESPPDWEIEALKAQAVTARTFATYTAYISGKHKNDPYDLDDTTSDQVYKGYGMEETSTNTAVNDTKGQVIMYDNKPIQAFFYSTSGGHTESSANVWGGSYAYLQPVADIEENYTEKDPWIKILTAQEIEKITKDMGENIGQVLTLEVLQYSDSGRAMEVVIVGSKGSTLLSKENIRRKLGLYSRKFTLLTSNSSTQEFHIGEKDSESTAVDTNLQVVTATGQGKLNFIDGQIVVSGDGNLYNYTDMRAAPGTFLFVGMGYGHGVGMSQSGAQSMALKGYNYMDILNHYYSDIAIEKLY